MQFGQLALEIRVAGLERLGALVDLGLYLIHTPADVGDVGGVMLHRHDGGAIEPGDGEVKARAEGTHKDRNQDQLEQHLEHVHQCTPERSGLLGWGRILCHASTSRSGAAI